MTRRPKETLNLERFMLELRTHQKVTRKKNATLKQVIPSLEDFKTQQIQSWMNVVLVTVPLWARGGTRCCLDLTSKQHFHDLMGLCNFCPTKQPRGSLHYQQRWQMLRKFTAISPSAILAPLKILWIECETLQRWNMAVVTFRLLFVDQCSPCPCEPWSFEVVSVLKMTLSPKIPPHLPQNQNLVNLFTLINNGGLQ